MEMHALSQCLGGCGRIMVSVRLAEAKEGDFQKASKNKQTKTVPSAQEQFPVCCCGKCEVI